MPGALKADEEDRVGGVPEPVLEVVLDAPRLAHAAGRENHLRAGIGVDRHGFLTGFRDGQAVKRDGVDALLHKGARFVVITKVGVFQIDARGGIGERAIDEHGEAVVPVHEAFVLDAADEVEQLLCAPDREGRDDHAAATVKRGLQHIRKRPHSPAARRVRDRHRWTRS